MGEDAVSAKTAALIAMGAADPGAFVTNLETRFASVVTSAGVLPVTRNDGRRQTCYVCCPSAAYLDYALSELRLFAGSPWLKRLLAGLVHAGRPLLRSSGLDRQVQINNWLFATNPLPAISGAELAALTEALVAAHPDCAIVLRSLNAASDGETIGRLREMGYAFFPARQVYLFDCRATPPVRHRDEIRDGALLARDDYIRVGPEGFSPNDHLRMAELYRRLYLDKYTRLNPQYGARFMTEAQRGGLVEFHGLRRDGQLEGIIGFFDVGEVMTAPIVGYDTSLPQETGLYRRLMALAMERARDRRMLFNMSAGAAGFKRNRGAVPTIEYTAAYVRHLPLPRRLAAGLVRLVLEKIGAALVSRFEL
jgi:hypothetical protein